MSGRHRQPPPRRHGGRHRRARQRQRVVVPVVTAGVVLAASGVAVALTTHDSGHTGRSAAALPAAAPRHPTVTPVIPTTSPSSAPTTPTGTATSPAATVPSHHPHVTVHRTHAPAAPMVLTVTGSASYLLVATPDGHVLLQRILSHGTTVSYRTAGLRVTVGDASAVRLRLGGHLVPKGRPGQVTHYVVP